MDILLANWGSDLRDLLPTIRTPALVLHRRQDLHIPFALGQYLAGRLPRARLEALDSEHHVLFFGDTDAVLRAIDGFLRADAPAPSPAMTLTPREIGVLRLLAEGLPNRDIALRLVLSEKTVGSHLTSIFTKLGVSARGAAAAYAFRQGYV